MIEAVDDQGDAILVRFAEFLDEVSKILNTISDVNG